MRNHMPRVLLGIGHMGVALCRNINEATSAPLRADTTADHSDRLMAAADFEIRPLFQKVRSTPIELVSSVDGNAMQPQPKTTDVYSATTAVMMMILFHNY